MNMLERFVTLGAVISVMYFYVSAKVVIAGVGTRAARDIGASLWITWLINAGFIASFLVLFFEGRFDG